MRKGRKKSNICHVGKLLKSGGIRGRQDKSWRPLAVLCHHLLQEWSSQRPPMRAQPMSCPPTYLPPLPLWFPGSLKVIEGREYSIFVRPGASTA
jgi:hypothetical protein